MSQPNRTVHQQQAVNDEHQCHHQFKRRALHRQQIILALC